MVKCGFSSDFVLFLLFFCALIIARRWMNCPVRLCAGCKPSTEVPMLKEGALRYNLELFREFFQCSNV